MEENKFDQRMNRITDRIGRVSERISGQFGKSAPFKFLFETYGFTPEAVAAVAEGIL